MVLRALIKRSARSAFWLPMNVGTSCTTGMPLRVRSRPSHCQICLRRRLPRRRMRDRKSTRLNSSHSQISYAVFCLKKDTCLTVLSDSSIEDNGMCVAPGYRAYDPEPGCWLKDGDWISDIVGALATALGYDNGDSDE